MAAEPPHKVPLSAWAPGSAAPAAAGRLGCPPASSGQPAGSGPAGAAAAAAGSLGAASGGTGPRSTPQHSSASLVRVQNTLYTGRPTPVSPFASRQRQLQRPGSTSASFPRPPSTPTEFIQKLGGSSSSSSAATGAQPRAAGVLEELVQFRAREDAVPYGSLGNPTSSSSGGGGGGGGGLLGANLSATRSGSAPTSQPGSGTLSTASTSSKLLASGLPSSLLEWVIRPGAVEVLKHPGTAEPWVLGEGAGGRVFKAIYRGEVVAAKEVNIGRSLEAQQAFVTEAQRMQVLRHPHVLSFYGLAIEGCRGMLVLEYCAGRDLHSVLQLRSAATGKRLFGWWGLGCRVACEVARALNYLHSKNVVHMDVKSSNVLLTEHGSAKLADVGISRLQTRTYLSDLPVVGTWAWVAPEVLLGGYNCTFAVDLYSFGVLLWEILTGERPARGHLRQPLVPEECSQEAADLMAQCGTLDPAARPTAQEALQRLSQMLAQGG